MYLKNVLLLLCFVTGIGKLAFWYQYKISNIKYPIQTIYTYNDVLSIVDRVDQNTFVFFDIDDTLITSSSLHKNYFSWWFKLLFIFTHPQYIFIDWENAYSRMWEKAPFTLVEPSVVDFINALKNNGAMVIGLTSMESGAYGVIQSMPVWRYSMLKKMGIEFSQQFADAIFQNFPMHRSTYPILYKGILCANQQNKGAVMEAFLNQLEVKPSRIIAFDDDRFALRSIGNICRERKIECQLICYSRSEKFYKSWDTWQSLSYFVHLIEKKGAYEKC